MMKVVHIISSLEKGGAETQLKLLTSNDLINEHIIITLTNAKVEEIKNIKTIIKIKKLNFKKYNMNLLEIFKLYKILKKLDPDIVQTWMYKSDLIGGIISKLTTRAKIYWNIRNTIIRNDNFINKLIIKFCAFFSYFIPEKIICCSDQSINEHIHLGYKNKFKLIFNGFDNEKFFESDSLRKKLRNKYKIINECFVIGRICRWHHQKDFNTLFKSIRSFKQKHKVNFKLVLAGRDINYKNQEIIDLLNKYELTKNSILMDELKDTNSFFNFIDLHLSTSQYGEGFPNVIAESMLTNTYCIATNVGDTKIIINNYGDLVKIKDYNEISNIVYSSYKEFIYKKNINNNEMRTYIINNFSINKMLEEYKKTWRNT